MADHAQTGITTVIVIRRSSGRRGGSVGDTGGGGIVRPRTSRNRIRPVTYEKYHKGQTHTCTRFREYAPPHLPQQITYHQPPLNVLYDDDDY